MLTKAAPHISQLKTNSETVQPVQKQNQSQAMPDFSRRSPKLTPANALALQRTVGNQAVTRLIARQKSSAVPSTIQRKNNDKGKHKDNFMRYLFSSIPGGYNQKDVNHKQAGAMARVLDQNVYDSKIIVDAAAGDWGSLEDAIDDYQQTRLYNAGLDLAKDIVPLLKTKNIDVIAKELQAYIQKLQPFEKRSNIIWGSLTSWGAAKTMEAHLEKDGRQDGSEADGAPEWMLQMEERMGGPKKTLYVRGHMLNNNLGGPGLDYNMVPFPGPNANGIKNVNKAHLTKYEKPVKDLYDKVLKGEVTDLVYKVEAVYPRAARQLTADIKQVAIQLNQLYNQLVVEFRQSSLGKDDTAIENEFASFPEIKPNLPNYQTVPTSYKRSYVETRPVQMQLDKVTFNDLLNNVNLKMNQRLQTRNIPLNTLASSVPKGKDLSQVTLRDLVSYVANNAKLWALEDERVPATINCEVTWVDQGVIPVQAKSIPVDPIQVELYNQIDAPYADRTALDTNTGDE